MPALPPDPCCLVPRGDWDRLTIYSPLDFVTRDGSSYVAVTENIGSEPSFHSPVWMLVASKGDPGPSLNPRGLWQRSVVYEPLDVVSYQGSSWIARRPSIGRAPAENSFWMLLAARGSGSGSLVIQQGSSGSLVPLFIQPSAPVTSEPVYLWIETGIGVDNSFQVWFEDSLTP